MAKGKEKYVFVLTSDQAADIFASLVMCGSGMVTDKKDKDSDAARKRGAGLLEFAAEWNDMFQKQRPQPNAPSTETPQ